MEERQELEKWIDSLLRMREASGGNITRVLEFVKEGVEIVEVDQDKLDTALSLVNKGLEKKEIIKSLFSEES